jgi:hypothetical protein
MAVSLMIRPLLLTDPESGLLFIGGYIVITLSVRPCTLYAQLLLNRLLNFYETLHICITLPADVHEGIPLLSKI